MRGSAPTAHRGKNPVFKSRTAAVVIGAIILAVGATGGAVAAGQLTGEDIENGSIKKVDLGKNSVGWLGELNQATRDKIKSFAGEDGEDGQDGAQGPAGPAGPKGEKGDKGDPGVTQFAAGAHYESTWKAHSYGETITKCPEGEVVTGGGFSHFGGYPSNGSYDLGGENRDIEITVSAPYIAGEYQPISESDSRFEADQWVVRGYNNGDTDQVVRAWVICADITQ